MTLDTTPTAILSANLLELTFILLSFLFLLIRLFEPFGVCLVSLLFLLAEINLSHRL